MRRFAAAAGTILFALIATAPAGRADGASVFYVSMRGSADPAPYYVEGYQAMSANAPTSVAACDSNTYFFADDDASAVASALSSGATVQLHSAPEGTDPGAAPIICLFQASQ
jgi:hypothetical protein